MCENCGKKTLDTLINVFKEELCEDCWDDYLMTDRGKLEYFIGIAKGDLPIEEFDADFLGHCCVLWEEYKYSFPFSIKKINDIESMAKDVGLLS
jgi:uncharacterized radical SAM superfamily protein